MKKIVICMTVLVLLGGILWMGLMLAHGCIPPRKNGIEQHGALHVEGASLLDQEDQPVVLRGMSSHGIEWFPRFLNAGAVKTLKEYGANVLRLAVYTDTYTGYIRHPETNLNYLYMALESALAEDMYVIVDWHILEDGDPNIYLEEALVFFRELSAHYGDHPGILYEICNEPNGDTDWADVKAYAEQVIPAIREQAPHALVLVGTPQFCTDFSGPMSEPLEFDNVMYTMHRYVDTKTEKPCRNDLIQSAVDAELPIFVSEWGTGGDTFQDEHVPDGPGKYQENAIPFLLFMEEHQISWTAWALTNADSRHSVIRQDCTKLSGWLPDELTPFGKMIFAGFDGIGGK